MLICVIVRSLIVLLTSTFDRGEAKVTNISMLFLATWVLVQNLVFVTS